MSSQSSQNKTNRREKENTDWLDKLINELYRADSSHLNTPYLETF